MAKFVSRRHLSLDFLGDEWKDCFIVFSSLSINQNRDLIKQKMGGKDPEDIMAVSIKLLQDHFIEGAGFDDETKAIVKLTKEDIGELPTIVNERAILFLVGEGSPQP